MSDNSGVVSVRFREPDMVLIRRAAEAEGLSVGAYVKATASRMALASMPGARTFRATNGARITVCPRSWLAA